MKKFLSILLIMALCLASAALAEGAPNMTAAYEDGNYVIRIPVEEGDEGWTASDMAQDDSVLRLNSAEIIDGVFTASYAPVGDGEMGVTVKHMDGIACDQAYTFDFKVTGNKIENTGGSYIASPDEAEQDPIISGEWQIDDDIMAGMTIAKNEGKGWALQIATAHPGVYVMQANLYYDCEMDEFVYGDGIFYESEITDSPEVVLGDVVATDTYGTIRIVPAENGEINLLWYNAQSPDEMALFHRSEPTDSAEEGEEAMAEGADSDWYMAVLIDPDIQAQYPYHRFVDVNQNGVPALFVSSTEDSFITDEDNGCLFVYSDGEAKQAMEFGGKAGEVFYCNEDEHTLTYFYRSSGESHIEVYHLNNGELELFTTADIYSPFHHPEVENQETVYLQDDEEISEEESNALWEKYANESDVVTYEPSDFAEGDEAMAEGADSDWYMAVLIDPDIQAQYPYHRFVDVNQNGVPALFVSSTEDSFITDEDKGCLFVYSDGEAKQAMEFGGKAGEIFYCNEGEHTLTYFYRSSGESHIEVYHLNNGELELFTTADIYSPFHHPEVENQETVYLQDGEEISEEESNALWEKYANESDVVTYEPTDS